MSKNIEAIFLDVGNTLRIVIKDKAFMADARHQITELVGSQMPEMLLSNYWRQDTRSCGSRQKKS